MLLHQQNVETNGEIKMKAIINNKQYSNVVGELVKTDVAPCGTKVWTFFVPSVGHRVTVDKKSFKKI